MSEPRWKGIAGPWWQSAAGIGFLGLTALLAADGGDPTGDVERGRYLVHDVAQCIQCHTPRDAHGNLHADRLLQGAVIPLSSPYDTVPWAFEAPRIAGLANYEPEAVVFLLRNGHRANGKRPRRPMPTFRMTEEDARDVVAYLTSLP